MSRTSKRHTQIDFQSLRNLQGTLLPQENEYGTPDKPMQIPDELRTVWDVQSRGEISSTAPSIETPLDAHGETSSTSPWFTYKRIYDLRLSNDFYVTVAEEMAYYFRLSTALHISPNSAWSMARLHAPMFWLIETGR
jgi:hypothetical protein